MRPLRAPSTIRPWRGLDFRSVASFIFCVTFASLVYSFFVLRQINILEKAQHAMCGGDLDAARGVAHSLDGRRVPSLDERAYIPSRSVEGPSQVVYAVDGLGVPWWAPVTARETRGHARVPGSDHRPTKDFPGPGDDRLARTNFPNGETDSQLRKQDANTPAPGGARTNRGKLPRRAPRRREAAHHVSYAGAL